MIRVLIYLFFTCIVSCVLVTSAMADHGTLHIYSDDYPPYNFHRNNLASGISTDILVRMFEECDMPYTRSDIVLLPWKRAYSYGLTVPRTMLYSMTRTPEREKIFKWVGPIVDVSVGLMARKDSGIIINGPEDLQKYTIGMVKDDIGEILLKTLGVPSEVFDYSPNVRSNIMKLYHRRIQLFSFDEAVSSFVIKDSGLNLDDFEIVYTLKRGDIYYAFHINTPDATIDEMQKALDKLKTPDESGTSEVDRIIRQYR
ncbi:MAG: substrate-binding periplasmic protein [Desulfovibrio sp.]